jgi:prevent-host-death family protein
MTMVAFMKNSSCLIQAGEFKAKCLSLMDEVQEKHISITITKHGKPVAKLVPIEDTPVSSFGCLKESATITGDILSPISVQWEAEE